MSPVSLLPILPILLLALATMHLVGRVARIHPPRGHYASIDGLRGYLALFVFLHHSAIWYFFLRFHQWGFPPSRVYSHFGPTSVSLFFMITAFLFFSKLLNARSGTIDWLKLYTARVCRILPLYLFALFILFLVVAFMSGFALQESFANVINQLFQWLSFMEPDINGVNGTRLIVAGVVWSLAFEWLFYFSLAFIGFFLFKIKTSITILVFAGIFLLFFILVITQFYPYLALERLSPFLGGIAAAFLARDQRVRLLAASKGASILTLLLLVVAVLLFSTVHEFLSLLCVSTAFVGIACGNTLFGVLSHATSRLLGQISYSIYLLHGILLFLVFRFVLGFPRAGTLSPFLHWSIIAICSIILVIICSLTYHFIERPGINAAPGVASRLETYLQEKEPEISKPA
jgi:peptidoglycan/LPS O-acetylase OafA/YrhL